MKTIIKLCGCLLFILITFSVCYSQTEEEMKRFNDYQFVPNFSTKDKHVFRVMDNATIMTPRKYPINMFTICIDGYESVIITQSNGSSSFQLLDMNGNGIMCKRN